MEIEEAIAGASASSSPGYTQISYQAIKWAWENPTFSQYTTALMQKCLATGYHPKAWRKAIAVALRKPNKPDYSNPSAYRLITLLECLGKILEKVIARRLTFLVGKHNLVPDNQFGGSSNSSTADAIHTFTNDVHRLEPWQSHISADNRYQRLLRLREPQKATIGAPEERHSTSM